MQRRGSLKLLGQYPWKQHIQKRGFPDDGASVFSCQLVNGPPQHVLHYIQGIFVCNNLFNDKSVRAAMMYTFDLMAMTLQQA